MPSVNNIKWKLMKVIEHCVQSAGGVIFGGYPRDKIIHDHYAEEFYKKTVVLDGRCKYTDASFIPETKLRMLIPNDIDCYMHSSKVPLFQKALKDNMLYYNDLGIEKSQKYFPSISQEFKHNKYYVTFMMHPALHSVVPIKKYEVSVDVISSDNDKFEPPFGEMDFECNSIILTADNEYKLSNSVCQNYTPIAKLEKLNTIVKDILQQKTNIIYAKTPDYRVDHMMRKGWTISSTNIKVFKDSSSKETCYICMDEINTENFQCKLGCCNGRLHLSCMKKLVSTQFDNCPMCRGETYIEEDDKKIVKYI